MKRFICFLLSVILCLSGITVTNASTIASGKCEDNSVWTIDSNGVLTIIPKKGLSSTTISHWYSQRDNIKSILIKGEPEYIGENCFKDLSKAKSVTIPDTVKSIDYKAFDSCASLSNLFLPEKLENIDPTFSDGCTSLSAIYISAVNNCFCTEDGILYNKDKTLLYRYPPAKADNEFKVPDSVKTISNNAFKNSCNLTSVTLPYGVNVDKSQFGDNVEVKNDSSELPSHITHNFAITTINPTCSNMGYTNHKCIQCGYEYNDNYTEKVEHIAETDNAIAPTCEINGLTKGSHCILCGTVLEAQQTIPALNHSFVDGKCTRCVLSKQTTASKNNIIKPSAPSVKKVKINKKSLKLYWKKSKNASGYQIQYAENKKFSKYRKTVTVKSSKSTCKTIKGLKSKKVYYIRIRAYNTKDGSKVYSKWSKAKKIKTK